MNKRIIALLMTAVLAGGVSAATKFVQPTKDGIDLYKNETRGLNETAIKQVGTGDRLTVLDDSKGKFKVKTADGTTGWIDKSLCASANGKAFTFDDAQVMGYLDNPTPIYIIDADNKDATPIKLDRSFADAVKANVDRETVERTTR